MIKNYFKIAIRNLWRHKGFSFINIVGLAVGITAFFLILMYVQFELSYDAFHEKADEIYRLNVDIKSPNEVQKLGISTAPMGPAIKAEFPEVLEYTRLFPAGLLIKVNNQLFQEDNTYVAEPSLFKIFSIPFLKGDAVTALKNPNSVVLNQKTAKKYFGSDNPIGKVLFINGKYPATVTGIIKDLQVNSQLNLDVLYSMSSIETISNKGRLEEWSNFGNSTYFLLAKGANTNRLQAKFPDFLKRHISEADRKFGADYALFIEPLREAYMDNRVSINSNGNMVNIYVFSAIALFTLLIAAINFINLTTARATERAKEVGIRKVIGAARIQLTIQFLGESVILCLASFAVATVLTALLLPSFNQMAGKQIASNIFTHGYIIAILSISLLIGLVAGAYPALTLSGFKPIMVLKGRFSTSLKGALLRKGLVVFQFTTSIILIVGTLVVYNQLSYMRNQPLGFDKSQLLTLYFGGDENVVKSLESIKNEFRSIPNVLSVSASSGGPGAPSSVALSHIQNRQGIMQQLNINMYDVDYDFIPAYKMNIVAGRAFSASYSTDSTKAIVVNEAATKLLGYTFPKDIIGKKFTQWGREGTIIGVVKDFNYQSLTQHIAPLNFRINTNSGNGEFTLKIAARNVPSTIAAINQEWKVLIPQRPFTYSFVDDDINKQYTAEDRFGKLFFYFAVLAIFISCMGLLGLASYSTMQRTREIGIRKVLGAGVLGIANMLSKDFLKLVMIAAVIAFPLAWLGMNKWMQSFAYKAGIQWWVFGLAGLLAIIIAISTVSFQAIKAALANPVKSLRSE